MPSLRMSMRTPACGDEVAFTANPIPTRHDRAPCLCRAPTELTFGASTDGRKGWATMAGSATETSNQGNQSDYVLGTMEGWDAFGVVRWHGIEELAQPYRYDITLQRPTTSGPVD